MTGRLAPSGHRFLPELSRIAELAVATATLARDRLTTAVDAGADAVFLAEQSREADRLAADVTTGAPRALVPPIEAEDAAALAAGLRDVVAATRSAARFAGMIRPGPPVVVALADLLVETADSLEGGVATLTDRTRAVAFARDVRRLAREGERAYVDAVASLLTTAPATLDAVHDREMCIALRESLRASKAAATLVERIALKRF
jgi:hypothetical protein